MAQDVAQRACSQKCVTPAGLRLLRDLCGIMTAVLTGPQQCTGVRGTVGWHVDVVLHGTSRWTVSVVTAFGDISAPVGFP